MRDIGVDVIRSESFGFGEMSHACITTATRISSEKYACITLIFVRNAVVGGEGEERYIGTSSNFARGAVDM